MSKKMLQLKNAIYRRVTGLVLLSALGIFLAPAISLAYTTYHFNCSTDGTSHAPQTCTGPGSANFQLGNYWQSTNSAVFTSGSTQYYFGGTVGGSVRVGDLTSDNDTTFTAGTYTCSALNLGNGTSDGYVIFYDPSTASYLENAVISDDPKCGIPAGSATTTAQQLCYDSYGTTTCQYMVVDYPNIDFLAGIALFMITFGFIVRYFAQKTHS